MNIFPQAAPVQAHISTPKAVYMEHQAMKSGICVIFLRLGSISDYDIFLSMMSLYCGSICVMV